MLRLMLLRRRMADAAAVGGFILFAVAFDLSVLPSFSTGDVTSQPLEDILSKWSAFDEELNVFLRDVSGIETLQEAYEDATVRGDITFEPVDGETLVQEIARSLGDLFSKRVEALQVAVKHAEKIAAGYKWDNNLKKVDCLFAKTLNDTEEPFAYDELYDQIVSLENSSIHIPVDIFNGTVDVLNSIAWTSGLDEVWKKNKEEDPSLVWQYFGSRTGVLRSFPATSWKNKTITDLYDVRRSKWYTQGVSSPKNMLILIERSGSSHGQALQLIKHSVKSLIDTLSENDFVTIAHFSEKPYNSSCFHTFVQANESNKRVLKYFVDKVGAQHVANYTSGFEYAFSKIENFSRRAYEDQGASCNPIIMLFTDGTSDVPRDVFKHYNPDKKIRVFSYAVGPMAGNRSTHTREIGCSNKGFFYPIPGMGAIRAQVQGYLTVLAPPLSMASGADRISWTSLHEDETNMGLVLAVTMPVFQKANSSNNFSQNLLGMMGVDVTLEELKNKIPSEKLAPNGYAFGLNSNGILLFHPVLDNIDIDLASPVIDFAEIHDTPEKEEIRKQMIDQVTKSSEIMEFVTAPDGKHDMRVNQTYHFTAIPGTQFSVAVVIPVYVRNYISEKRDVNLEAGIELLLTNDSRILINTAQICKLDTNETSASSGSNFTVGMLAELLLLNASDCDAEAVRELLFDVMITSSLEDKWTGKERRKEEKRHSFDLPTHELNHDQKRDINGLVTNEPTHDSVASDPTHDQAQDSHDSVNDSVTTYPTYDQTQDSRDSVTTYPTHDPMQDSYDSVTTYPTHDKMQDSRDSVTTYPTHDQAQDSRDSVTTYPAHDQAQDSRDSVTTYPAHDQAQDSRDSVTNDPTHDEKQDSNDLLINGAIIDDEAPMPTEGSFNRMKRNAMQSMDVVYARFVTMGKDFSRVHYQSVNHYEYEGERENLKTFMERLHERSIYDDVWIFALYPEESYGGENATRIFASKTVSLKENNYRAATIGVQFTLQNFSDLVSSYESSACNSLPEGSDCYILDDGGFILWHNMGNFTGTFFGIVDPEVMDALIKEGVYRGRAHTDYQAISICEDGELKSAGFRIVPPFIYEILSLNWWTTATTWMYLNIANLYSWLFTTQVPYVAAAEEDKGREKICVRTSHQYHYGVLASLYNDIGCDNCTRSVAAARLPSTNLLMVATNGQSCNCAFNFTFPSIGTSKSDADHVIDNNSDPNSDCSESAKVRYRKKPPCHDSNEHEPDSYCGASSTFVTSPYHITLLVSIVLTKLLLCHPGGH